MIKRFSVYITIFIAIATMAFVLHKFLITQLSIQLPFSLINVYLFHIGFFLMLCVGFLYLFQTKKFRDQLGFLYLFSVALKIILFCIVFYKYIFSTQSYSTQANSNLLIPMALMLVFEVLFISKLLKNQSPIKNTE